MKSIKSSIAVLMAVLMMLMTIPFSASASEIVSGDYTGKTVVIHSNDVHGSLLNYAKIVAVRDEYKEKGAEVILVDAGDYSQGTSYVSDSKGEKAIEMMNAAGYDYATIGNHEFDYGYDVMLGNLSNAKFSILCANLYKGNKFVFDANAIYTTDSGLKIGFFGLITPQTVTSANPSLIKGLTFLEGKKTIQLCNRASNRAKEQWC